MNFWKNEAGASTVEWVVIAAVVVGIAIALLSFLAPGIGNLAETNANVLEISN